MRIEHKHYYSFEEFCQAPLTAIFLDIVNTFLYFFYLMIKVVSIRIPQLVWEMISTKGYLLHFSTFVIASRGINIESVAMILGAFGTGVLKYAKDKLISRGDRIITTENTLNKGKGEDPV